MLISNYYARGLAPTEIEAGSEVTETRPYCYQGGYMGGYYLLNVEECPEIADFCRLADDYGRDRNTTESFRNLLKSLVEQGVTEVIIPRQIEKAIPGNGKLGMMSRKYTQLVPQVVELNTWDFWKAGEMKRVLISIRVSLRGEEPRYYRIAPADIFEQLSAAGWEK